MTKIHYSQKNYFSFFIFLSLATIFFIFPGCAPKEHAAQAKGYYTCSMHPQVIQDKPGNCPICGMNLVFVEMGNGENPESNDQHDHSKMETGHDVSNEQHKPFQFSVAQKLLLNARITTVPVKLEKFDRLDTYSGHVDYNEDPDHLVSVTTKYDGWVEKLYISEEGQNISRGMYLLGIYSQKLLAAKEEHLIVYKSIRDLYISQGKSLSEMEKDPTLNATRQKLLYLDVPWSEIQSIEKNLVTSRLTYFRAPISGVLVKKNVLQGKFIQAGHEIFQIANMNKLWIYIHIFDKDLPFIKKGDRVEIKTQAYSDKIFKGEIDLIYPFLRQKTRDIPVRIIVNNKNGLLKPGMYVNVEVKSELKGKVLTIPEISVVYSGNRNYVFVSIGRGKFEVRAINVFAASQGKVIVSSGLKEKELIVANGQFLLDSEASLKEALAKGQMSGHHH